MNLDPCGQPARLAVYGGGVEWNPCSLDAGHRGYHSVSTFLCDQCGASRRLPWAQTDPESGITLCFLCQFEWERDRYEKGWD